jgi:carboxylate-amine ligase
MFRSTIELLSGICNHASEVKRDLEITVQKVMHAGEDLGIVFAGTGTHPLADYNERILSASPRYHLLLDRNQWLIKRMAVYGLHVHLGMRSGEECIRYMNFYLHFLPQLIALSASSPYWKGNDTGLAASRPTTFEAHPTSGIPYVVGSWEEFNALYDKLIYVGSIESMKDIWWDLRPSPMHGTLEIRICDGPATLMETEALVTWIHLLGHWYADHMDQFDAEYAKPETWILRENKWRTIRYGLDAQVISQKTLESKPLRVDLEQWLEKLSPYIARLEYETQEENIRNIIAKGNSSLRQRKVFEREGDLNAVVSHIIREFEEMEPIWPD